LLVYKGTDEISAMTANQLIAFENLVSKIQATEFRKTRLQIIETLINSGITPEKMGVK